MKALGGRYGATPLHLLAHGIALALAGYALLQVMDARGAGNIALWLIGAVILHDFALLPVYSALDGAIRGVTVRRRPAVNFLRVPLALSALLLLVYFPVISGRSEPAFRTVSGLSLEGYLGRWLLLSAGLFAASALLFVLSGRRRSRP